MLGSHKAGLVAFIIIFSQDLKLQVIDQIGNKLSNLASINGGLIFFLASNTL